MEKYEILETIGTGAFGKVVKIKRKADDRILVWKELNYGKMEDKEKQQLVAEVNILRDLKHPNIVRYYDRIIDKHTQQIYLIQEYCEGGDLAAFIKKCKQQFEHISEDKVWKIFLQIVLAAHEIHRRKEGKILHRDIKPANIFLDSKQNIKLGDFGLAKRLSDESVFTYTTAQTPYYISPEQINENKYTEKSDIWSIGCLLYEICQLSPPFSASNACSLAEKIKKGKFQRIPSIYSDELMRVIIWSLHKNFESRPSVDDLLSLPQISIRLREKRLKENFTVLQSREQEIKKKEEELDILEKNQKIKEKLLNEKEQQLKLKLKSLEDQQQLQQQQQNDQISTNQTMNQQNNQDYKFNGNVQNNNSGIIKQQQQQQSPFVQQKQQKYESEKYKQAGFIQLQTKYSGSKQLSNYLQNNKNNINNENMNPNYNNFNIQTSTKSINSSNLYKNSFKDNNSNVLSSSKEQYQNNKFERESFKEKEKLQTTETINKTNKDI